MRTFQPERALLARETREENHRELARMLTQVANDRADRLPASPPVSLEAQFQESIRRIRYEVQREKDAQTSYVLHWLRS